MTQSDSHDPTQCARAWAVLRAAHNAVSSQLSLGLAQEFSISLHEFDVLLFLYLSDENDCRVQDLHAAVPLSQPALSRLIVRIAERGLIERMSDPADGRVTLLRLSSAGRNVTRLAIELQTRTIHAALTSKLVGDEHRLLLAVLDKIGSPA